jgi:MoaA/NifB/PqqE/SkfB family radical SAM enzyme
MINYTRNLLKLARHDRHLHPRVAIYYVTGQCNLNCAYCEDFGARRNGQNQPPLPLAEALKILRVLRSGVDALMLTGGEPLTHPEIDQLLTYAKKDLKFRELTLISNGFLLPAHETALSAVDRLIVSLDSLDPQRWSQTIGVPPASAETILANIRRFAGLQPKYGYRMIVNAVLTPETLPGVDALVAFCVQNKVLISFSPQSFNNWPRYELTVSPVYRALIEKLLQFKRQGAPILGSDAYLRSLAAFAPYDCYPTLVPRVYPNGDLSYPCRPLEKADNGQGGRGVNLLTVKDWAEAWESSYATYGQPPRTCHSCFQQCYAEPSLMQARPLVWLGERLRSGIDLSTYSPG